jgi:pimeloyl-ACP methyl ester carboxylesterase
MNIEYAATTADGDGTARGGAAHDRLLAGLSVTQRRLQLAGISTPLLEGGDGPPMVLLHGPGEFAAKWLRVLPELVKRHRVVAPDLPGHGSSEVEGGALDEERVIGWLGALIESTCPSPPVLVGHVLGGAIAARFAMRHGNRIDRLVLVDTLGLAPFRPSPAFALTMIHFMARPSERTYGRFMNQCSHDLDRLRREMGGKWSPFVAYNLDRVRTPSVKKAIRSLMTQVGLPVLPPEELRRIPVPVDLIWGRHDRANRLRIAQAASARYGWPLHVIEECADDPPRDQPRAFLDALDAFTAARAGEGVS